MQLSNVLLVILNPFAIIKVLYNMFYWSLQVFESDENKPKKPRCLRKITKIRLKNIALYYLKRFESSTANLRNVLQRRVNDYARQVADFDKYEAYDWIEEILTDFQNLKYLDDNRYTEIKVQDYLNAGKSERYIK